MEAWDNTISDCTFIRNTANQGGAINLNTTNYASISNCVFVNNDIYSVQGDGCKINNNIFMSCSIGFDFTRNYNIDNNWFGNNASNYTYKPNEFCNNWLFLNATTDPNTVSVSNTADIIFKLYAYNSTSGNISKYDNAPFKNLNLTITATNGNIDKNIAKLGETIKYTASSVGTGNVSAKVENVEYTIGLDIIPIETKLILNSTDTIIDSISTVGINVTDINNNPLSGVVKLTIKDNKGNEYNTTVTVKTGITTYIYPADKTNISKIVNITGFYLGNDTLGYVDSPVAETKFRVDKLNATVNLVVNNYTIRNFSVNITVTGKNTDRIVENGSLIIYANREKIDEINITDGKAENILLNITKIGNYELSVAYSGNNVFNENNTFSKNVTAIKISTIISANNIITTYNTDKYLEITLLDSEKNPLNNATLSVDLNGAKKYTTYKNGQIKIALGSLVPKTYTAKVSFAGNDIYSPYSTSFKVVVEKATPTITAKTKIFKFEDKTKKYTITLKNNKGIVMKNTKVTLTINGKTYTATTNTNGVATFKFNKLNKKGTYTASITYSGDKYYNKLIKKAKIKIKAPAWKTVAKGSKNKAIVKKIQKTLKNNGYYLKYNGRYLKIDGIFQKYTQIAVKHFQKANKLKTTGKVDYKTAKKLKII
ncbi:hypothetical protein A9505_03285 [Methanobrevibacter sp. A27]|nr:hypothetical protein A9505_03285 [Methanobrevibacter sp. A27]